MSVSVENNKVRDRIDYLRETSARVKFLSLEPLIGPLKNMNLKNIDWVIVGGESGHSPRPMNPDWVLDIQDQCERSEAAFFLNNGEEKIKKQLGDF